MFNRRVRDFNNTVQNVFSTEDGKKLLKYLKEDLLDTSPMGKDNESTFYKIGQADLVRQLIAISKNEEAIESTPIVSFDN